MTEPRTQTASHWISFWLSAKVALSAHDTLLRQNWGVGMTLWRLPATKFSIALLSTRGVLTDWTLEFLDLISGQTSIVDGLIRKG